MTAYWIGLEIGGCCCCCCCWLSHERARALRSWHTFTATQTYQCVASWLRPLSRRSPFGMGVVISTLSRSLSMRLLPAIFPHKHYAFTDDFFLLCVCVEENCIGSQTARITSIRSVETGSSHPQAQRWPLKMADTLS